MQRGFSKRQKDVSRLLRERRDAERAHLQWEKRKFDLAAHWRQKAK